MSDSKHPSLHERLVKIEHRMGPVQRGRMRQAIRAAAKLEARAQSAKQENRALIAQAYRWDVFVRRMWLAWLFHRHMLRAVKRSLLDTRYPWVDADIRAGVNRCMMHDRKAMVFLLREARRG